nr:NnrS family protein [Shimia biformata]
MLGAPYRVMFPLAAIWAVASVWLWQWGGARFGLSDPVRWHAHEMLFGLGGAALMGYLPTASASWTGRAPVCGWRVMGLAVCWGAARLGAIAGLGALAPLPFLWLAWLLWSEARIAGRGQKPGFLAFCIVAGGFSALVVEGVFPVLPGATLLFAGLFIAVGGRMVPAFLNRAVPGADQGLRADRAWLGWVGLCSLVTAAPVLALGWDRAGGVVLAVAGLTQLVRWLCWPLASACCEGLLTMLALGYLWLPLGLVAWAVALAFGASSTPALHLLLMGGMGGLVMAVSARAFARRTSIGLRARNGQIVAFSFVWVSVWLRVAEVLPEAAALWSTGWGLFLLTMLPGLRGPVPRPVFSGARQP